MSAVTPDYMALEQFSFGRPIPLLSGFMTPERHAERGSRILRRRLRGWGLRRKLNTEEEVKSILVEAGAVDEEHLDEAIEYLTQNRMHYLDGDNGDWTLDRVTDGDEVRYRTKDHTFEDR